MVESSTGRISRSLKAFLQAETWDAARRILEKHPELSDRAAVDELDQLIGDPRNSARTYPEIDPAAAEELLHRHRQLLVRSRAVGSRQAFAELVGSQQVKLVTGNVRTNEPAAYQTASSPATRPAVSQPPAGPTPFVPAPKRSAPAPKLIWALVAAVLAVVGSWLGKVAALEINDEWISTQLAAGGDTGPGGNRWVLVAVVLALTSGLAGAFAAQGLNAGLRAAVPALRRSKPARTGIAVTAALLLLFIGLRILPPALTPGDVRFADGPPDGEVVLREGFDGGQPPWSTRLGTTVGVFLKSGAYHVRVKAAEAGSRNWGVGVTRPTSQLRSLPADVRVDATAQPMGASPSMSGVACRQQSDTRFYFGALGSEGEFRIGKLIDGTEVTFASGTLPETINPAGSNRLQLACVGGQRGAPVQLVLWVNGQRLAQATDRGTPFFSGPTLASGSVGVAAASSLEFTEVTFDDVALVAL